MSYPHRPHHPSGQPELMSSDRDPVDQYSYSSAARGAGGRPNGPRSDSPGGPNRRLGVLPAHSGFDPEPDEHSPDERSPGENTDESRPPTANGAQSRQGMILTMAMAAVALGVGGYFLVSSKGSAVAPVAFSAHTNQSAEARNPSPPIAEAPNAANAPEAPAVTFTPPSDYSSNSLVGDPGCVAYNNATNASSDAIGDAPSTAQATAALTVLGGSLQAASGQAQDATLAAALAAESTFVEQNQPTLVTALVSGDSDSEVAAYQPIEVTDDYVSAVCGSDENGDTSSD